ncbi:serine/threonine-protein phosphatase [Dactylosporangium sp. NBC_01737]|uniref:PP2C family protein-serine/threonine phosphatase n=1 Tax=Dactylosporangium sp. NBC_01737 TaxID=2975959 RepID=UPI002E14BDA6|nr:serine/threonine-protein phosphatase [Dactylosporangium sp. NBC_01737]
MAEPYRAMQRLLATGHHARPEDLPTLAMRIAPDLDASAVVLYLVDYDQLNLMPMAGTGTPARDPVPVDGTMPGRVFAVGRAHYGDPARVWLPLIDGTERLGVLEVVSRRSSRKRRTTDDATLASAFAELIVARRVYGDAIEHTRRREPMQVAAEIVWSLLPPLTFATDTVTVTGILEPCYDMGGDTFDYAVHGDVLHFAIFDAMGHGMAASTLTAMALSAYRNARRCGLDLLDSCKSVDKWIASQFPARFATATFAELDTATGVLRLISAGHPAALLLRDGRHVKTLPGPTYLPLGLGLDVEAPVVVEEALEPGDQVLLYTDGVIEARTDTGEFFGVERLVDFIGRALADKFSAPETMRRLVHAILAHQHEQLQDDASALLVRWHPDTGATAHPQLTGTSIRRRYPLPKVLRRLRTVMRRTGPAR